MEARFDGFTLRIRTLEREKDQIAAAAAAAASSAAAAAALERSAAAGSQGRLVPEPAEGLFDADSADSRAQLHKKGAPQRAGANGANGSGGASVEACAGLARLAVDSFAAMAAALEDTAAALDEAVTGGRRVLAGHAAAAVGPLSLRPQHEVPGSELGRPSADNRLGNDVIVRTLLAWACARLRSTAVSGRHRSGEAVDVTEDARASGPQLSDLDGDLADGHVLLHLVQARTPTSPPPQLPGRSRPYSPAW